MKGDIIERISSIISILITFYSISYPDVFNWILSIAAANDK